MSDLEARITALRLPWDSHLVMLCLAVADQNQRPIAPDGIAEATNMPVRKVHVILSSLEMGGLIAAKRTVTLDRTAHAAAAGQEAA